MGAPSVIVIVDEDAALCGLLAELLSAPGRVVDTVSGTEGLTADLISLSKPKLVLLNPRIDGVGLKELRDVVIGVRERTGARFVLMVSETDAVLDMPKRLGADEQVPINLLLADPLRELALSAREAGPEPEPVKTSQSVSAMSLDDILSMDLTSEAVASPPPASRPSGLLQRPTRAMTDLAALIDDELNAASNAKRSHRFDVTLDSVSDNNLVVNVNKELDGLFVSTLFAPSLSDRVELRVALPWGETLEATGTVSWLRTEQFRKSRGGFGCTIDVTPQFKKAAERFMWIRQPMTKQG